MSEADYMANEPEAETAGSGLEIAIVGMAGRFPGARDLDEFWHNLRDGVESISQWSVAESEAAGVDPALARDPNYVRSGGVLNGVEYFDAAFFGYYPREAEIIDPQQRVFLECAWAALENAGYDPERYNSPIGVFAGASLNTYLIFHLLANRAAIASVQDYQLTIASDKDFLPTRVSYKLNLRGPSVNVQTACSSSLVAVHQACQSLLNYQCDMALAGGVSIRLPQHSGYLYQQGSIASPDGHCRAFDAQAAGTVPGNGVGIVVLKRLADAVTDGDYIYAVIKGAAINNDGANKVGYTAPSVDGQAEVIAAAQALAEVEPESISYIEAHGTGTALGDPIEITALNQAFQSGTDAASFCAIGSLKTNIGHLDAAAGVAGLIKTALALEHSAIPPSLHFGEPNPAIPFANSPFVVNTELRAWERGAQPRRAGVSSFGIGGTNAHVIVEEAPEREAGSRSRPQQLLLLSAKTEAALDAATANLLDYLKQHPDLNLADAAYTLQMGRQPFTYRRAVVAQNVADAVAMLEQADPKQIVSSFHEAGARPVAFMFTGQGSQYVNMGRELYESEPIFRDHVDACAELLRPHLGLDLRTILYPSLTTGHGLSTTDHTNRNGYGTGNSHTSGATNGYSNGHTNDHLHDLPASVARGSSSSDLNQTWLTQPALFTVEYALAQLWQAWGVQPQAMIGHSIGEYVAACLAGVFSLEDALALVAARGRLMQGLPGGAMLSVPLSEAELRPLLSADLALASINSPTLCVVSGTHAAIAQFEARLAAQNVQCRRLHTSHAFHSAMMDPILSMFEELVASFELSAPSIPFVSNVTGTWISAEQATDPHYWATHVRQAVRFADGVETLLAEPQRVLLEVGPGHTLTSLARQHSAATRDRVLLASVRHPQDQQSDAAFLLLTLGRLWLAGVVIDWHGFYAGERRLRVPLPTYPFERQRYWVEPKPLVSTTATRLIKQPDVADWFYAPAWQRADLPPVDQAERIQQPWLVFADDDPFSSALVQRLISQGQAVIVVRSGKQFVQHDAQLYDIDPWRREDYQALIDQLRARNALPRAIVHAWTLATPTDDVDAAQARGFYSLLWLAQALDHYGVREQMRMDVVTSQVQDVLGDEAIQPARATVLGPCLVIPQEYPHIACRAIDIVVPQQPRQSERLIDKLIAEFAVATDATPVAYRGAHRWAQTFVPMRLSGSGAPKLRPNGVYLITGGLGNIGLTLAEYIARTVQATVVLIGRTPLPERNTWPQYLSTATSDDLLRRKLERVLALEALGSRIVTISADVADAAALQSVIDQITAQYGALHGVLHAAGFVGAEALVPIAELNSAACEQQFAPKLLGTLNLARVLHDQALDFCILQSSLSTVLGGLGMAAYAAANCFMDAFVQRHNQRSSTPWLSANWDGWHFGDLPHSAFGASVAEFAVLPHEGAQAFERLLALADTSQMIVSTADLASRITQQAGRVRAVEQAEPTNGANVYARPRLRNDFVAPRTPVEQTIAEMWRSVLGLAEVGAYDDFFELGGHSLLATQIISRLRDLYHVEIPLRSVFETPTVAGLAAIISAAEQAPVEQVSGLIQPVDRAGEMPLSFAQHRLWFLDQLEPGSALYNNPAAMRVAGPLDVAALERCIAEIARRHEVLRTTYENRDGRPVPVVTPTLRVPLKVVDLRTRPAAERAAEVQHQITADARQPFDLRSGPLFRVTLLQTADHEHVALLTMHHIVSDGWSVGVLIRELAALYTAYTHGQPASLPALPIQYADYAAWQRSYLQGATLEQQLNYWREHLRAAPPLLELPTDRPRPAVQTFAGGTQWFSLPRDLSAALDVFSQREDVTPFMTLLAAFQTLLHRYSRQDDISVGTPIANRTRGETEDLIGCFVNTLVLRSRFADDMTFRDLLAQVREAALGAYAHQDVPFEMLVDELQPARDLSHTPLFQAMFVLQNAPMGALQLPGVTIEPLEAASGTAKFDLTLSLEAGPDGLRGWLNYNTDLFNDATMTRLLGHFETLLRGIVADAGQAVDALPLLTEAEYAQFATWNRTSNAAAPVPPIHALIAQQAARMPDALAVAYEHQHLTYAELNDRANQLARYLHKLGVGRETLVGVCMERSLDLIVGLLGVLKAGAAYLPLDPSYPPDRLDYMLLDARVPVVLTQRRLWEQLPKHVPQVVCLDAHWSLIAPELRTNVATPVSADDLAYLIYTSGSTGKPKGVQITHGALAEHCRDIVQHYALTPQDRVLQFAALNFDASLEQILPTLIAGATLVLRDTEVWTSAEVAQKLHELGLTVANLPTAYWHQLAQELAGAPDFTHKLRLMIVGGDALRAEGVQLWRQTPLRDVRLLNAYGPTETTITATTYDVPRELAAGRILPIGRVLPNRTARVLDRLGQPVPIGVPGELYLGGQGVARGYLNRPELTAEKFVRDSFTDHESQTTSHTNSPSSSVVNRLYRTGDLVRWLPDGNLEFLGRVDHQIKLRGFRIELGEIEAVLAQHPAVRSAVVVAREDNGGDKRLVAYIVHDAERGVTSGELRGFLLEQLPAYMVPATFMLLEALPLTPSGKLDRNALPAPTALRPATSAAFAAPRTPVEDEIASIWRQLLNVDQVGIHDTFFELGGHSLLATQMVSRLRAAFQVELPLRRLFETPTIAGLAVVITQAQAEQADAADLAAALAELEGLSDADVQELLAQERQA